METKLTTKDLMIGDWVKIKEPNKYAGAIGTIQTISSLEGAYLAIYINDPNFGIFVTEVFSEDIEPIPLTAEALEKNGFYFGYTSQQEDAASQIGCSCEKAWTYDEGGGSIQVTFPNECDGGLIVLDEQDFDKELEFVFANQIYVNELQHLLRICHVEKEIVL